MEYFFEGKVKSISIRENSQNVEYNVDFKSNYMFIMGNEEKYVAVDKKEHSALLTIKTGMFNPITKDIFTFISMHSKETFKVYFEEILNNGNPADKEGTNSDKQVGEGNTNNNKEYEITKVELIYG